MICTIPFICVDLTSMAISSSSYSGQIVDHVARDTASGKRCLLAHFSDLHFACVDSMQPYDFVTKRFLGYLRWKLKRQVGHNAELLTILRRDLQRTKPDHMVITGDLTHLSLPAEFAMAHDWLKSLGTADRVTVVPGNHDAYIRTRWNDTFACCLEYMAGDPPAQPAMPDSLEDLYPTVRIIDPIALIGINTARPSSLHLATGTIGAGQLEKLEMILRHLAGQHLFRILLLHHPPVQGVVSRRKSLTDMEALHMLLQRYGVELVLFGHAHESVRQSLNTAAGVIPAIGAASASSVSHRKGRLASYYLYEVMKSSHKAWQLRIKERIFCQEQYDFVDGNLIDDISFPFQQG